MKLFADTADIGAISALADLGLIDGVTTNPSLVMKSGRGFKEVLKEICGVVDGPVSAEVAATDFEQIMKEAAVLADIAPNICIKLPLTLEGLKACRALSREGCKTNVTLCFSASQALLAAKAGATYVSPFVGRLDDINQDGLELIRDIRTVFDNYPAIETEILAASLRTVNHVSEVARIGSDAATIPPDTILKLVEHPLTKKGLETFLDDWAKTGQKII
ncbi:fructose-6-phosphate aldolase [Roseibium sp.]|uniref:fructose-6-phosphate aldolase n=1 Tax=Roseibium sp. TaxID=1936156 RepID=UPI003D14EC5A